MIQRSIFAAATLLLAGAALSPAGAAAPNAAAPAAGATTSTAGAPAPAANSAPTVAPGQAAPVAHPYDESADAHAQVDAALAQAKATGRTVLLDFGGNWCPDCRMLAGVFQEPTVTSWLGQHFILVTIDIGRRNKNMDISTRWGVSIEGVPTVLMIAPNGTLLNKDDPYGLADARSMSTQAVVDLLAKMAKS